jgi:hypothetical protein
MVGVNAMATGGTTKHALLGKWRIVETELWDLDDLDLLGRQDDGSEIFRT